MMKLIGVKRLMIIAVLLGLAGLLAAVSYLYLIPKNTTLDQDLRKLKSDISFKRSEADRFRQEMAEIQNEKNTFESMQKIGFLGEQSRMEAAQRIEAIQSYSRVLSAKWNIAPGIIDAEEQSDATRDANRIIFKSQISVSLEALDDADVYSFIDMMENAFMGHVSVTSFELERVLDLNEVTLRQIGSGIPAILVKATVVFEWKTLITQDQAAAIMPSGSL